MATFNFTSPDGNSYTVTGPDDATQEQAFAILQQQIANGTAQSTNQPDAPAPEEDSATATAKDIDSQLQSVQDKLQAQREEQPGSLSRIFGDKAGNYRNSGGGMGMVSDVQSQVNDNRQKRLSTFIPQARELVGTPKYAGMNETDIATELMNVADAKAVATTAATVATLPAGGTGGLLTRIALGAAAGAGSEAAGQVAAGATDAIQSGDASQFGKNLDGGDVLKTGAISGAASGALPYVGRGLKAAGGSIANTLSDLGVNLPSVGISRDAANIRRFGDSTNADAVRRITQSGVVNPADREAAQTLYNTATTDASGNSILLPDQILDSSTRTGRAAIDAQNRNIANGGNFSTRQAEQQSGDSIRRAVDTSNYNPETVSTPLDGSIPAPTGRGTFAGTPTGTTGTAADNGESLLQRAARNIGDDFRQSSSKLYTQSKDNAQAILDDANIKTLKLPDTKQVAQSHIDADDALGRGVNLTPDARRTLNQFGKANFNSVDDIDKWKRTLNEKANKAYRNGDIESSNALKNTVDSLRNETDSTLSSIDPRAGSLYRDADAYYRESIGDEGAKSQLGKISANPNEQSVENSFFSPTTGEFNTRNITQGVDSAIARTAGSSSQQGIADSAVDLGRGLGSATRERALDAATRNGDFNAGVLSRTLNRTAPQANAADEISSMGYRAQPTPSTGISQSAMNNSLADAADTIGATRGASSSDSLGGGLLRSAVGTGVGALTGGPIGAVIGAVGGAAGRRAIASGFVDAIRGTNKKSAQYIDWLSNPTNAAKVEEHLALKSYFKNNPGSRLSDKMADDAANKLLAQRANELRTPGSNGSAYDQGDIDNYTAALERWSNMTPKQMREEAAKSVPAIRRLIESGQDAATAGTNLGARQYASSNEGSKEADRLKENAEKQRKAAIESRTLNRANEQAPEAAPNTPTEDREDDRGTMISPRNEALYSGIVNAETGGLDDPWIRTKAKDKSSNLESSAYGPAQLTGSLVSDVLNRYPDIFTPEEKLYAQYFIQQAQVMNANPNDPTYGYGKKGVLGSTNKMKGLYNSMARKILNQLDQENGGDYNKVLQRWRGVNDQAYFNKVDDGVNAYVNKFHNNMG